MSVFTQAELEGWEENGYIVLREAVPPILLRGGRGRPVGFPGYGSKGPSRMV